MKKALTIKQFINAVDGTHTFFSVSFIKRGNGELRNMLARMHVTKGVKGVIPPGDRRAEDIAYNILTVYDVNKPTPDGKGAFRRINLELLISVKLQGVSYLWDLKKRKLVEQ